MTTTPVCPITISRCRAPALCKRDGCQRRGGSTARPVEESALSREQKYKLAMADKAGMARGGE